MDEFTRFKKNGSIFIVIFFTQLKQILLKFGFFSFRKLYLDILHFQMQF